MISVSLNGLGLVVLVNKRKENGIFKHDLHHYWSSNNQINGYGLNENTSKTVCLSNEIYSQRLRLL